MLFVVKITGCGQWQWLRRRTARNVGITPVCVQSTLQYKGQTATTNIGKEDAPDTRICDSVRAAAPAPISHSRTDRTRRRAALATGRQILTLASHGSNVKTVNDPLHHDPFAHNRSHAAYGGTTGALDNALAVRQIRMSLMKTRKARILLPRAGRSAGTERQ